MQFTGEFTVDAAPEDVWAVVTDPDVLVDCIPGAESVERVDED
jgi:carbon monoxide dehydrogenase subunit G